MPHQKRTTLLLLAAVVLVALVWPAQAQDADADRSRALLGQGLAQFRALNFRAAKATLLKVDRDSLQDADRQVLDEHLSKVDTATRMQAAAAEALRNAGKALKAGNFPDAQKGFATAAASEHLPPPTRHDAEAQLALVNKKMEVAAAKAAAAKAAAAKAAAAKAAAAKAAAAKAAADKAAAAKAAVDKAAAQIAAADKAAPDKAAARIAAAERASADKAAADSAAAAKTAADRTKALELLQAGNQALDNHQHAVAVLCFQRALVLAPDLDKAREQLARARSLLGTISEAGPIGRLERLQRIRKQEADVEFKKHLARSQRAIGAAKSVADFENAVAAAQLAENVLLVNKRLYPKNEYQENQMFVQRQLDFIQATQDKWEKRLAEEQRVAVKRDEAQRILREREQRSQKISVLTARVRALTAEHKYGAARDELDRIVALDPNNYWATEQKEMLGQFVHHLKERGVHKTLLAEEQWSLLAVREAQIPWYKELTYPRNWKELSARRLGEGSGLFAESEADRTARARLRTRLPRLDFDDIELKDVIQFLRDVAGVNIYVKWQSLSAAGVERATTVNIHLGNVTVEKALRIILDDVGGVNPLGFIVEDGVVMVTSREDLQTRTITRVYDIRDMILRVPNFLGPRMELDVSPGQARGGRGGGGGGGGGGGLFQDEGGAEETMSKAEIVARIVETIKSTVDPASWTDETRVGVRELHGQLIITQTVSNHQAILDLIGEFREARALQINIETRFIEVTTGFLDRVGLNLGLYFNIGSRLGTGTTTITDPWTGGTTTVDRTDGTSFWDKFTPIEATGEGAQGGLGWIMGTNLSTAQAGDIASLVGTTSAMSVTGTFLNDIQVDFLVEATQAHSTSRILTAPRITLFNGQRAYITVATLYSYVSSYEPTLGDNAAALSPIIAYVPTGAVLDVEATVSADRRYVTLTVRPQVAARVGGQAVPITIRGGGMRINATIELQTVRLQDLQATCSVPDGGTLLLGGLRTGGETEREIGVPILNKIPIINRAFTNRGKARDERTLLILVKPKIIIQREEEEDAFPS